MTNKRAEGITGVSIIVAIIGFVLFVGWRFLAYGFWSALGAAVIYVLCVGIIVGLIAAYCFLTSPG